MTYAAEMDSVSVLKAVTLRCISKQPASAVKVYIVVKPSFLRLKKPIHDFCLNTGRLLS